jgi:penicillin-binding protein 1A
MTVFTWKGEKDTIMTPMDSIRYYKHFLQSGLMAMEPQTGNIKAWVGGIDYKYFQYDHVGQRKTSTFKPLFTLRRLNN